MMCFHPDAILHYLILGKPQNEANLSLRIGVGQPTENRVLWLVITFEIQVHERPLDFTKFFDFHLQRLSNGVSFFEGHIFWQFNINLKSHTHHQHSQLQNSIKITTHFAY